MRDNTVKLLYYELILQDITKRKQQFENVKRQLLKLRIEIDHQKQAREVAESALDLLFSRVASRGGNY